MVWIVDVTDRTIEVLTDPVPSELRYASSVRHTATDAVVAPWGVEFRVDDLLFQRR